MGIIEDPDDQEEDLYEKTTAKDIIDEKFPELENYMHSLLRGMKSTSKKRPK